MLTFLSQIFTGHLWSGQPRDLPITSIWKHTEAVPFAAEMIQFDIRLTQSCFQTPMTRFRALDSNSRFSATSRMTLTGVIVGLTHTFFLNNSIKR